MKTSPSPDILKFSTLIALAVAIAAPISVAPARADIVTPNEFANTEAPGAINLLPGSTEGQKQLWIISSSQFSALSGPTQFSGINMRPNGDASFTGMAFGPTVIHNLQITVGTTTLSPGNVDTDKTFADYLTNSSVVFSGNATISSSFTGPSGGPKAFDINFGFALPFTYNPASGNLVVQFAVNSADGIPSFVDGVQTSSVPVANFGRLTDSDFTATTGFNDSFTPVLQFTTGTVSHVPDLSSTLTLLALSLVAMFGLKLFIRRLT